MKIFISILLFCTIFKAYSQISNYPYHEITSSALINILDNNYNEASLKYKEAFIINENPLYNDLYNYAMVNSKIGNFEECEIYLKILLEKGAKLSWIKTKNFKNFHKSKKWKDVKKYAKTNNFREEQKKKIIPEYLASAKEIMKADQKCRPFNGKNLSKDSIRITDSLNFHRFLTLYEKYGFPTEEKIGEGNFYEYLELPFHHFTYKDKYFDKLKEILLKAYQENLIPQTYITYYFDMNAERVHKYHIYGNIAYYVYKRKEYEPYFVKDTAMVACVEAHRKEMGMLPFRYYQKVVKANNHKSVFKMLFIALTKRPDYMFDLKWEYQHGTDPKFEEKFKANFFEFNNCP